MCSQLTQTEEAFKGSGKSDCSVQGFGVLWNRESTEQVQAIYHHSRLGMGTFHILIDTVPILSI